jgi:uncharacterized OsmC-like protein
MEQSTIVNTVQSATTHVLGRTLNSTRNHHFIVDGTSEPKEEITPVEVFLSAVSSCCVHWIEKFAREDTVDLNFMTVDIEGSRLKDQPERFQYVAVSVKAKGPSQAQLEDFVERFKGRCPLYRTVAAGTEVKFDIHADALVQAS